MFAGNEQLVFRGSFLNPQSFGIPILLNTNAKCIRANFLPRLVLLTCGIIAQRITHIILILDIHFQHSRVMRNTEFRQKRWIIWRAGGWPSCDRHNEGRGGQGEEPAVCAPAQRDQQPAFAWCPYCTSIPPSLFYSPTPVSMQVCIIFPSPVEGC